MRHVAKFAIARVDQFFYRDLLQLSEMLLEFGIQQGGQRLVAFLLFINDVHGMGIKVAQGLQRNAFGQGVVASLAILALGIALDRVTQGRGAVRARSEQ